MCQASKFKGCTSSCCKFFGTCDPIVCIEPKLGVLALFNAFAIAISFMCHMQIVNSLTSNFGETQDFDGELQALKVRMQKQVVTILKSFLSFLLSFQSRKIHNRLVLMLDPQYKGLRLVIQYVCKEQAFQILAEYDI
jgi:hypothetical protein